jgi:nicotinic acid mononucleotide adenylyltransferase
MAQAAMSSFELSETWFLVNPRPAHKTGAAPLQDRVRMVQLATEGVPGMRQGAPHEVTGRVTPHTMADFERLMGMYPDTDFVFIVGADVLVAVDQWREQSSAHVIRHAQFAAVLRPGQVTPTLHPDMMVEWFFMQDHAEASSRHVRLQLQAHRVPESLDPKVYAFVTMRGLYQ